MKRLAALAFLTLPACQATQASGPLPSSVEPKLTAETLEHQGRARNFLVHDYSGGKRAPVVIVLHGGGGDPENGVNMSQMDVLAAREHFIAVYPGGTGGMPGNRLLTWNATHCCAYARENKVDDVGFIAKLIDGLVASGRADPKRVYVTGMSNGGMMSLVLGRELPDRIAAIAPIVGAVFGDEPPAKGPVAAVIFVGQDDKTVPAAGGPLGGAAGQLGRKAEDHDVAPDVAQADYWVKANGCTSPVESFDKQGKLVEIRWDKCNSGKPVHFYRVVNNGHAWPGGKPGREGANPPNPDFHANEIMWRFFKDHPRK